MASESVILELLRQAHQNQSGPSQFERGMSQISQVMDGVTRGIQLYDAAKSLPYKYGTPAQTTTTTLPAIPGTPDTASPSLRSGTMDFRNMMSGFGQFGQPQANAGQVTIPGAPAIPAQQITNTTMGTPGSLAIDQLAKLKDFTGPGVQQIYDKTLEPYGIQGQIEPAMQNILMPNGSMMQAPRGTKIAPTSMQPTQIMEEKDAVGKTIQPGTNIKIVDTTSGKGGGGKTPEDRFASLLATIEDDVRSNVKPSKLMEAYSYAPNDPKYLAEKKKLDATQQAEFSKLLESRGSKFPKEWRAQAMEERYGLSSDSLEALMFNNANKEKVGAIKGRLQQSKQVGRFDPIADKKALLKAGFPESVIDQIFAELQ